jgi:1-deoxy-D-xylulose-5-phosphate synthase
MSIAPNVGAISSFLSRKLTGRFMTSIRYRLKNLLKSMPSYGEEIYHILRKAEESFKSFFTPGIMFEGLGFHYVGPINGHNFSELLETFNNIKQWEGPILVHVLTKKGKGYSPAESDPYFWHGVEPFDVETGKPLKPKSGVPTFTSVFGKTMVELAEKDNRIVAITAAMPGGTGLDEFARRFPERFFDVGIAEQHGITFAAGLASAGFRPVAAIYSTFMQRAYDQILHDVCLQNLPVVLAMDRAGIVGADGATHQGLFDISYLRSIPNIVIMAPKDEDELRHMLKTAVECGRPAAIRYPRGSGFGVPISEEIHTIEIGRAELLQDGNDIAILALGHTVYYALDAEEILNSMGIRASVVNMRFVKPLDVEMIIHQAQKTGRIVTVEENVKMGGFGSAVLECLHDHGLHNVQATRIGIPDEFVEHGPQDVLRKKYGLSPDGIVKACLELLGEVSKRVSAGKK